MSIIIKTNLIWLQRNSNLAISWVEVRDFLKFLFLSPRFILNLNPISHGLLAHDGGMGGGPQDPQAVDECRHV